LGYNCQIVESDLTACAGEELKSVDVTADESLEGLAVYELQIHFAAVGFHQTKA
jgi:hypothetical protein